jgi:outer membrane protein OmpA-like peptidoglycan-associated protein
MFLINLLPLFFSPMPLNYQSMKVASLFAFFFLFRLTVFGQDGPIIEDFSSNKRIWPTDTERKIENGVYFLSASEDGSQATINFYIDDKADFETGIDFTQRGGSDQSIFGLVWNSGYETYNAFLITPAGEYIIISGELGQLKGWKKTKAIQEQTNTLKVQRLAGKDVFFINDVKVEERKASPFFGQWGGILTLSQVQLEADNFYFKQEQAPVKDDPNFATFKKENLGDRVNSNYDDLGPIISSDGKTIYFSRQNVSGNVGGEEDKEDVWYSAFEKGLWGFARNMGKPINSPNPDNLVAVGSDNNTMLFKLPDGLAFRYRSQSGWTDFEKMNIAIENESGHFVGSLSSDGSILVFSAMMKSNLFYNENREENDLFVSFRDSTNNWSAPLNLGKTINTAGEESSPFLSPDGRTLYFASNGRPGYGDLDIFIVQRQGDGWHDWSEPLNLGPSINSPAFDAYYTLPAAGNFAYLVSYDGGFGKADIFRVKLSETVIAKPVVLIHGKVVNKKSEQPVGASIVFEDLSTNKKIGEARSDPKTGTYQIVLPFGSNYGFMANADGFFSVRENLDATKVDKFKELDLDLLLVPMEVGEIVKLNNVFFDAGLSTLQRESFGELNHLATMMRHNPAIYIELAGHTDNRGTPEATQKLSEDRIEAVKNYLVYRGVEAERITGYGYGATKPIAASDTEENRLKNRRVEFKIVKK